LSVLSRERAPVGSGSPRRALEFRHHVGERGRLVGLTGDERVLGARGNLAQPAEAEGSGRAGQAMNQPVQRFRVRRIDRPAPQTVQVVRRAGQEAHAQTV
jgi:hypothetical protein